MRQPLPEKHVVAREPQEFPTDAHPPGLRPATRWKMQTRGPKRGPGFRGIEIAGAADFDQFYYVFCFFCGGSPIP